MHALVAVLVWTAAVIVGCSSSNPITSTSAGDDGSVDATVDATTTDAFQAGDTGTKAEAEAGPACAVGQAACGTACVTLSSDVDNCGACGAKCSSPLVCSKGACAVDCGDSGTTLCSGACADLTSDPDNCGACGTKCAAGKACTSGQCTLVCSGGTTACGTSCVDTKVDPGNCGGCGKACTNGGVCNSGACSLVCTGNLTSCTGGDGGAFCAETAFDPSNCGGCGKTCGAGLVCSNGTCAVSCQAGLVLCGTKCVNPVSDPTFCGASGACTGTTTGKTCTNGQSCVSGACTVVCPGSQINCSGTCVDPTSSSQHCGATAGCGTGGGSVGIACPGGQVCANSACVTSCPAGEIVCGGGCVDPTSNNTFCGASGSCTGATQGTTCPAGDVCSSGRCQVTCQAGLVNCNGTCVDPRSSLQFCGASGNCQGTEVGTACSAGSVCSNGICAVSCQAGLVDCSGTCVDPRTNPTFCGASSTCNGDAGTSGTTCTNGTVCLNGVCGVSCPSTPTQEVLCSGTCVDPQTDNGHCGATAGCDPDAGTNGTACAGGLTCVSGTCQLVCPSGHVACSGVCIDPNSDNTFCGATAPCTPSTPAAGQTCNTSIGQVCQVPGGSSTATCVQQCPNGQLSCAGSDGGSSCVDPNTDLTFCGASGNCSAGPSQGVSCEAGNVCSPNDAGQPTCQATCGNGLVLCPGATRCSDPEIDSQNCGSCGHTCGADNTCVSGRCTQTHILGPTDLINQSNTQDFCPPIGTLVNGIDVGPDDLNCSGADANAHDYGFQWTDNGELNTTPVEITFTFAQGFACDFNSLHDLDLNGQRIPLFSEDGSFSTEYASEGVCNACPISAATTTISTTSTTALQNYVSNATNSFTIAVPSTGGNVCEGLSPLTGDTFAIVTVTY